MQITHRSLLDAALAWLAHGLWGLSWWQILIYLLATTHVTVAAVTIFLHRAQAHRAVELGVIPSHFFRFWLWIGTGMVTKEWVAVHRKHHAKCETKDDPHSPHAWGINTVLWRGSELYRTETANKETLAKYGRGTPDDWIENTIYTRHAKLGVSLMLMLNVVLLGTIGITAWAIQMMWIPFFGGVINGIGHFWGYRNFEASDASSNICPWGLVIGGEELHNNHHTYPTSAKFSVKKYEIDVGWFYILIMQRIGWAKVKKLPPKFRLGATELQADEQVLEALIAHRYEVMARYGREIQRTCKVEFSRGRIQQSDPSAVKAALRWLHRDDDKVPVSVRDKLLEIRASNPVLDQMLIMREKLRQIWLNTSRSREQLAGDLRVWCRQAEKSDIDALRQFSIHLRFIQL